MDHQLLARILLAVYCGLQGLGTAIIDLGRTHATHPRWIGHARYHVVWQTCTVLVLAVVELALLLGPGPLLSERFYLSVLLAGVPVVGFFAALVTRRLYGGTLSDPEGIPPLKLRIGNSSRDIDLNVVAEVAAVCALLAIVAIFRSGQAMVLR